MSEENNSSPMEQELDFLKATDAKESQEFLQKKVAELRLKLGKYPATDVSLACADLLLELANAELGISKMENVWSHAKRAFDIYLDSEQWEQAVECCDLLYQTELPSSISALGHGVWLAVTFPISVQHTINMLNYIINETQENADGAALAAIVAHFVVDMRCEGEEKENLRFITMNMVAKVAKRHSKVETQTGLDVWMEKLELLDPAVFLPRFSLVVGAIVGENWWYDKDQLRAKIPD